MKDSLVRHVANLIAILSLIVGCSNVAWGAPQELYNKTIYISYTVTVPIKGPAGGTIIGRRNVKRWIYVSTLGRIFARAARAEARQGQITDKAPGEVKAKFQGSTLVGVVTYVSGATQMTISFDGDFHNCTLTFLTGKESGQTIRFRSLDGALRETAGPMTFSDQTCAVKDGNVFAGE
jgi:hypothetical protein